MNNEWHKHAQRRHLGGLGGRRPPPPQGKSKKEKKKEKKKKEKKEKKREKERRNYEWRQITTYKVLFFQFFNSPVALKNKKIFCPLQEKVEMTPLNMPDQGFKGSVQDPDVERWGRDMRWGHEVGTWLRHEVDAARYHIRGDTDK